MLKIPNSQDSICKIWTLADLQPSYLSLALKRNKVICRTVRLLILIFVLSLHTRAVFGASCTAKPTKDIVIVLDVGHIAREPGEQCQRLMPVPCPSGQISARGIPEYAFNIRLAQRVDEELVHAGFASTYLMVTSVGGRSGLYQRVDRANKMKADVFLSIHHDGVRDEYLKPWMYNGEQRFFFDGSAGFSLHVSPNNVKYRESMHLAQVLADQLIAKGLHFTKVHEPTNPAGARVPFLDSTRGIYRRRNLIVLSKTDMPAVLVEAGVIVNRTEESVVSAPAYQGIIAAAIVGAVEAFCNPRESTATYKVVNVTPDDALSVRSGPDAAPSILGAIPAEARGIRILGSCSEDWCQVEYHSLRGWVNRRFLSAE